jgi:cell wall-associated NlpC family hydrolase
MMRGRLMLFAFLMMFGCSLSFICVQPVLANSFQQSQLQQSLTTYSISFTARTAPIITYARSGSGTNYSIVATFRPNTTISFNYLAYGTLMNDYWRGWLDPRWYGFSYSGRLYWLPSAQVNGNPPMNQLNNANRAIAWAINQQGSQQWNGWCERFVENAFGTSGRYLTAQAAFNALHISTNWSPNIGALVWFIPNAGNQRAGHVGIYVGQNYFLSATYSGVKIMDMSYWSSHVAAYEGWGNAPSAWPGHN